MAWNSVLQWQSEGTGRQGRGRKGASVENSPGSLGDGREARDLWALRRAWQSTAEVNPLIEQGLAYEEELGKGETFCLSFTSEFSLKI